MFILKSSEIDILQIFVNELRSPNKSVLVCIETSPVLRICFGPNYQSIWVSTTESNLKCWKIPSFHKLHSVNGNVTTNGAVDNGDKTPVQDERKPLEDQPTIYINGGAAIISATVLNDKRHIITKDVDDNVAVYDVLKVCWYFSRGDR